MRERAVRLVVVGDIAWDILFAPDRDPIWGSDVHGAVNLLPGGSAANLAVWARRAGAQVTLVGKIGDDAMGRVMRLHLIDEQLADAVITVPGAQTTRIGVLVSARGERAFVIDHESLLGFEPGDCPPSLLEGADAVFFNGYGLFASKSPAFISELLDAARRQRTFIVFDPSSFALVDRYGPRRLIDEIGPVDALLANEEEAAALASGEPPASLLGWARMIVLKQGARGATVIQPDGVTTLAAPPAAVVDTTGAGDAFGGAFLANYLAGVPITEALGRANRFGAYVVSHLGAQPPWPARLD